MTTEDQATPEQWAMVASRAASANGSRYIVDAENAAPHSCLLELRSRIKALEATQHAHADTSGLSNEERKAVAEQLREPGGFQLFNAYKYKAKARAAANAQKLTLVDRVADAIAAVDDEGLTNMTWSSHARAAIRVVAEWVRENPGPSSAWSAVARDLMDEASR